MGGEIAIVMAAALADVFELGPEGGLILFAAGRVAGWLAHALEQQSEGGLIRPRASYVGRTPDAADAKAPQPTAPKTVSQTAGSV